MSKDPKVVREGVMWTYRESLQAEKGRGFKVLKGEE